MQIHTLIYFSLNEKTQRCFIRFAESNRYTYKDSFRILKRLNGRLLKFNHTSDLLYTLDKQDDLGNTYVIVDYISLEKYSSIRCIDDSSDFDSISQARDLIRRAILKYPEVMFLFDETGLKDQGFDFSTFLFNGSTELASIYKSYHIFDASVEDPFSFISLGRDNLFDGSNIRYASRRYIHNILKVNRFNHNLFQKSRRDSLALCIEEEHSQNRFNSYALYANGFRIIPVVTAKELNNLNLEPNNNLTSPSIIVRDFDLQFPDSERKDVMVKSGDKEYKISMVDLIRGVKFWDVKSDKDGICPDEYINKWFVPQNDDIILSNDEDKNKYYYWTNLLKIPTIFISKGVSGIELCKTRTELQNNLGTKCTVAFQDKKEIQFVRGIRKPVSGIYCPFHYFKTIRDRYASFEIKDKKSYILRDAKNLINKTQDNDNISEDIKKQAMQFFTDKYHLNVYHWSYWRLMFLLWKRWGFVVVKNNKMDKLLWKEELKEESWVIDTSREKHDHGVPLDIYDLVQSMLSRAKQYYIIGKYIRAAIISTETIELLNGFHEALTLQAYHILAISENAIAMNAIGGSELALKEDTIFRINKIENEIERILNRTKNEGQTKAERRDLKYNILNQIFSNCREFCKDKEYFEAENCFISAMAHVNEGFASSDIWHEIEAIWKRIGDSWRLKKDSCQK